MNYQKAYENAYKWREQNWILADSFGMMSSMLSAKLNCKFVGMRNKLYTERYRQLNPKKHKLPKLLTILSDLPEEDKDELNQIIIKRGNAYGIHMIETYDKLHQLMWDWAKKIDLSESGELRPVKKSDIGTYRSQGWGAEKYAKLALESAKVILEANGYETQIYVHWYEDGETKYASQADFGRRRTFAIKNGEIDAVKREFDGFALMARLDPYQLDAIIRNSELDMKKIVKHIWESGGNPRVIFPHLSDELFWKTEK